MQKAEEKIATLNLNLITVSILPRGGLALIAHESLQIKNGLHFDSKFQTFKSITPEESESLISNGKNKYTLFMGVINLINTNFLVFCEKCKHTATIKQHKIYEIKTVDFVELKNSDEQKDNLESTKNKLNSFKQTIASHFSKGYYFCYTFDLSKNFDKLSKNEFEMGFNNRMINCFALNPETKPWMVQVVEGFAHTLEFSIAKNVEIKLTFLLRISETDGIRFCELSIFNEIKGNLGIRKFMLADVKPEYLMSFFEKIFRMWKSLAVFNAIENQPGKNAELITDVEELLKPKVENRKDVRYKYLKRNEDLMDENLNLLELEAMMIDTTRLFSDCDFTNFSPADFRNNTQKAGILLLFSDVLGLDALMLLFYGSFFGLRRILTKMNKNYEALSLSEFEAMSGNRFTQLHSKVFQNLSLLLTDSPRNSFSKNWTRFFGLQKKIAEPLFDMGPLGTLPDKAERKAQMYFGEITGVKSDKDVNLLELESEQTKTGNLNYDSSTNLLEMDVSQINKKNERLSRSKSKNTKPDFERQKSTNNVSSNQKGSRGNDRTPKPRKSQSFDSTEDVSSTHKKSDFYRNKRLFLKIIQSAKSQVSLDQKSLAGFRIFLMTWNLAGLAPEKFKTQLKSLAFAIQKHDPDIVYFGFQELFELKIKLRAMMNFLNIEDVIKEWKSLLGQTLPGYKLYYEDNMVALQSFMYVRGSMGQSVLSIDPQHIKLGVMNFGNKGAIKVVLNFNGYLVEISNCHLTAGQSEENFQGRLRDLQNIFAKNTENMVSNNVNCAFLLGDFNFKIRSEISEVHKTIKNFKEPYRVLKNADEWTEVSRILPEISEFQEEKIVFPPTFKYLIGEREIDQAGGRTPSWCDRVYYYSKRVSDFRIIDYNAFAMFVSDHIPVFMVADVNKKSFKE